MKYKIEGKVDFDEPCNVFWCDRIQSEIQKEKEAKALEKAKANPNKIDQTKKRL